MNTTPRVDTATYRRWRDYLEQSTGIALGEEKGYLIETRLAGLLERTGVADFAALLDLIRKDEQRYRQEVIDALTTHETTWFRDESPFAAVADHLLPAFARELAAGERQRLRFWCAACSTGQEPYSLAITLLEYAERHPEFPLDRVSLLATDISTRAVAHARAGVYTDLEISRGLSPQRRERFFDKVGNRWAIKPTVRRLVEYRPYNLMDDLSPLGTFDVIFCRYVAIYFAPPVKRRLLQALRDVLRPGGYLFLGTTESPASPRALDLLPEKLAGAPCFRAGEPTPAAAPEMKGMDPARIAADMARIRELLES